MYGQQECRETKETIEKHWKEIVQTINNIEERKENFIFIDDANRLIGNIVPNNSEKISYGGSLIREFLESDDYTLLNGTEKVVGGPWTRIDLADESCKSVLDILIISNDLYKYVETMEIDEKRLITPFKNNKDKSLTYSDHLSLLVTFKNIPLKQKCNIYGKKITR